MNLCFPRLSKLNFKVRIQFTVFPELTETPTVYSLGFSFFVSHWNSFFVDAYRDQKLDLPELELQVV